MLAPDEVGKLVSGLLRAGVQEYFTSHTAEDPDFLVPLTPEMDEPVQWPIQVALTTTPTQGGIQRPLFAAAFGSVRVNMGLQRSQLKELIKILTYFDEALPKSDKLFLGDEFHDDDDTVPGHLHTLRTSLPTMRASPCSSRAASGPSALSRRGAAKHTSA